VAQSYRFGRVEVRPAERTLLVEGKAAHLGARAFDVLVALLDRRDRVVSKDELFDVVWPGLVVEENNLHVQISALRKLLGAEALATVAGRGFRFVAPVETVDAPSCPPPARNHNLPEALNSFVGRAPEIARVKEMLAASRLVTLSGTGGTGKTRLSLRVAQDVLGDYPDGIWFVELAPLTDGVRVAQAVASVLGVKEDAGHPVLEALLRYVRDRRLLLVLDNCEHVLQPAAELVKAMLVAAPHVRALASSREALHVTGEAVLPVPALEVPAARDAVEALARCDSVRLFVDRAAGVLPAFKLTAANAPAVASICRRLDGIALAIELAAARVGSLSVEQIASRLDDSLRLVKGGDRTAQSRQQTLRGSIDWSYDLLEIAERELFRRLAVFTGGWTLEAAEAVGAGGDVQAGDVVDLLTRLVDKSLVAMDASGERYRLLDTVRQYAQELLVASGEDDAVRGRHLDFFLRWSERAREGFFGPASAAWLARVDDERENILVAHAWCDHAVNGAPMGLRIARATKGYWISRGLLGLGYRVVVEALARCPPDQRDEARCRGLFDAGQLAFYMGRYAEAQRYLEESLAIARALGDRTGTANALQPLGMACLGQGNLAAARAHLEESVALARELGDKRNLAAAMNAMAQLHRTEGTLDIAERLYRDVVATCAEMGDDESRAIGLLNLAMVEINRARPAEARALLSEAMEIAHGSGFQRVGLAALEVCAGLCAARADFENAARFFGVAEAQNEAAGLRRDAADDAFLSPLMDKARTALGARYRAAEHSGRALDYAQAIAQARSRLAEKA